MEENENIKEKSKYHGKRAEESENTPKKRTINMERMEGLHKIIMAGTEPQRRQLPEVSLA
jgi:hypothetical protein